MKRVDIILLMVLCCLSASAQVMYTQIFNSDYKSLEISPRSNQYFPPIWVMGQERNPLVVSFDHISEEQQYLRYSIVHCNSDWQPSALSESEYTSGFNYADIEDVSFSAATFAHYVHYRFSLPNEEIPILRSGNYIVKVYPDDDPENIILQARFSVCENVAAVGCEVSSRTDVDYNENHQQLAITVNTKRGTVADPYNDIKVVVSQNSRIDNESILTKPLFANSDKIVYEHDRALIFPAGNEFRRFETVAINAPSMGVELMEYHDPFYHAVLRTDDRRVNAPYLYDKTQYGHFTVRNWESNRSDTEADYVVTHFALNTDGPLSGGKIYIVGEFTNYQFTPAYEMHYDMASGLYLCDLMLKQGAYNYQYIWVPDNSDRGFTSVIEGDKYQTVNEYLVKVYQRQPGDRYDRFIAFGIIHSGK